MGGTERKGEKKLTVEEFLPIYGQVKKEKDQGCYEDFIECLKLYDKNENGLMLLAELQHSLLALGNNNKTKKKINKFQFTNLMFSNFRRSLNRRRSNSSYE